MSGAPWTADEEAQRLGFIGAGLEPTLRHYWRGCPTDVLALTLAEYVAACDAPRGTVLDQLSADMGRAAARDALTGVIADLRIELEYRGAEVTR